MLAGRHPLLGAQGRRAAHPANPPQPGAGEPERLGPVEGLVRGRGEEQVVARPLQPVPDQAVVLVGPEQAASGLGEPPVVDGHPRVEPGPAQVALPVGLGLDDHPEGEDVVVVVLPAVGVVVDVPGQVDRHGGGLLAPAAGVIRRQPSIRS